MSEVLRGMFGPCFLEFLGHERMGAAHESVREVQGDVSLSPPHHTTMVFQKISEDIRDRAIALSELI